MVQMVRWGSMTVWDGLPTSGAVGCLAPVAAASGALTTPVAGVHPPATKGRRHLR